MVAVWQADLKKQEEVMVVVVGSEGGESGGDCVVALAESNV